MTDIDWSTYRKCKTCGAETGEACTARTGKLGSRRSADQLALNPHSMRQLKTHGNRWRTT